MSRSNRGRRGVGILLGIAAACSLALPALALAEPQLGVEVSHTPESIARNDEQLTYLLRASNEALTSPEVGDTLTCNGVPPEWGGAKAWNGAPRANLSFTYQWLRNGTPIGSGAIPLGGPLPTYVVVAADAGAQIQCLVTGTIAATNPAESMAYVAASQPGVVVAPTTSPAPPVAGTILSRATMSGTPSVGEQLQCSPPSGWSGTPTWTFTWLRNGSQIAAGPTYVIQAADEHTQLQCVAKGTTGTGEAPGGGGGIATSLRSTVGTLPAGITTSPFQAAGNPAVIPQVEFSNTTSGEVRMEFELPPGGAETRVYKVKRLNEGGTLLWSSCTSREPVGITPAKVICTSTQPVGPQQVFERVEVVASLGAATPDPAIARATISGGGSPTSTEEDILSFGPATPFGIKSLEAMAVDQNGNDYKTAGGHPTSATASFEMTRRRGGEGQILQVQFLRDSILDLPAGFIGNPQALPQLCPSTDAVQEDDFEAPSCPRGSIAGHATVVLGINKDSPNGDIESGFPIYAIEPERGAPAQFEFYLPTQKALISLTPRLRASEGYAIRVEAPAIAKNPTIFSFTGVLCGFGTNVRKPLATYHGKAPEATGCKAADQAGVEAANPKPFLTNPTSCPGTPPVTTLAVDSWENRGRLNSDGSPDYSDPNWLVKEAASPPVEGCEDVPFAPGIALQPTSSQADSPTGLDVSLTMPTDGLESPEGIAQGYLKRAVVTLPKGMAVNPAAADGLAACSSAQIGLGTNNPVACPNASKVGTAEIVTPILAEPLTGSIYLAKQGDNPFGSLLALYLVAESEERGVLIKLPGRVEPQPDGQLRTTFDNNPQAPIKSVDLHFNSGNRAALLTPPKCGKYDIVAELSPWSAANPNAPTPSEIRTVTSSFEVTSGPGGGPCPTGALAPKLSAGLQNPVAATTSPFVMSLSREDGSQRFSGLEMTLPPGLTAYLKGIPYCPDVVLAAIPGAEGTGASQLASPSCPGASQVGSVSVGAGGGSNPFYVNTGRVYLAGPYKGAPISLAIVTPAVAGPFDLGSVVVRAAAYVDPETARITVKSDPIPTILHGIPLDVRDIRVSIDRPNFTLAPTSCDEMAVAAQVLGTEGASVPVSNRFQVGECAGLSFKPKLSLTLKGGTKRSAHPALTAVLTQPEGQANIKKVSVTLPRAQFIDQSRIGDVCTRPQFAAGACPAKSILGTATAYSPLLDKPLIGTVYLRANGGERELPDMVADLNGQVHVVLVGYVDAVVKPGTEISRIRNTFALVPDAPVSKFVLKLNPGKKALLENSADLCKGPQKANVKMDAQNSKYFDSQPLVKNDCKKKKSNRQKKRR